MSRSSSRTNQQIVVAVAETAEEVIGAAVAGEDVAAEEDEVAVVRCELVLSKKGNWIRYPGEIVEVACTREV